MRSRGIWAATLLPTWLVVALALVACGSATSVTSPTAMRLATPSASTTAPVAGRATFAWTAFDGDGAIQVWIAASAGPPRLLATLMQDPNTCAAYVAAGLPMLSPDGAHVLVSLGQRCGGLILDPGPLIIIDVANGRSSMVPLPDGATVLPQVRSYGWVDNRTVFAFSQYNFTSVDRTYLFTLGAGQPAVLAGLDTPLEGMLRGSTLFYLQVTSGEGGIQSIVRRYDLAHHAALAGGIDLGAYASCSECPDMVISPGWDVAADGGHVVFQRTTPRLSGGIATSEILYATADGGNAVPIAQNLATVEMAHLRLSPDGKRVVITVPYSSTSAVITACVDSPGTRGDPCFATYSPGAASLAAWSSDGQSFLAATVDASYGLPTTQAGSLVRYTLGSTAGQPIAVAYGPWSAP